jgi:hypothetical protein
MSNELNVTVDAVIKKMIDAVKNATRATDAARRIIEEIEALRTSELNARNKTIKEAAAALKANTAAEDASRAAASAIRAANEGTRVKDAIVSKITTLEEQLKQKERLATKTREAKEAAMKALHAAEHTVLDEKNKFNKLNRKNGTSSNVLLAARRNMPMYIKKVEALTDAADKVDQNIQQLFDRIVVLYELDKVVFGKISEAKEAEKVAYEEAKAAGAAGMKAMIHVQEVLHADAEKAAAKAEAARAESARAEAERAVARAAAEKEEQAEVAKKSIIDEFKDEVIAEYTRFVVNNNHSLDHMCEFLNTYFIKEELLPYEIHGAPDNWDSIFKDTSNLYKALRKAAAFSHPDKINKLGLDDELLGTLHGVNIALSLYMGYMKNSEKAGGTRRKRHIRGTRRLYKRIHTCKTNRKQSNKRSNKQSNKRRNRQ